MRCGERESESRKQKYRVIAVTLISLHTFEVAVRLFRCNIRKVVRSM